MPNVGKPSKDCHLCRSRRVKCDLGRPGCQRCTKYGVECPGYRDQQDLIFRNANPASIRKKKKRARHEDALSSASQSSPSSTRASTPLTWFSDDSVSEISNPDSIEMIHVGQDAMATCLPPSLTEQWTSHSIPILLNVYSTLEFINKIYERTDADGPLVWAAHLFSRTYVTNIRHSTAMHKDSISETNQELGIYLGKTLKAVSMALERPDGAARNDVLATVWILANYELLIGSLNGTPTSPWHMHTHGLYSILKSRGVQTLYTESGRMSFWPAFNLIQVQCLLSNLECPPETKEWLHAVEETLHPLEIFGLRVCRFVNTTCGIISRISCILLSRVMATADAEYTEVVGILAQAKHDMDVFIESDAHQSHNLDMYMKLIYDSALIKGYHYILLMTNYLTHYPLCSTSTEALKDQRAQCLRIIRTAAGDVLDNIPYWFNSQTFRKDVSPKSLFDALKVVWPLTAVYVMPSTLPEQSRQAQAVLTIIGKELGIRQALRIYNIQIPFPEEVREPVELEQDEGPEAPPLGDFS